MAAVIEPHPQPDIRVVKDSRRHGGHVEKRGITQQDRVKSADHNERDGGGRLFTRVAGAVVTPKSGGAGGIHQRELELAGPVKIHPIDSDPSLMVEQLGHRRLQCQRQQQHRSAESETSEEVRKGWIHGCGRGGGVAGRRPGIVASCCVGLVGSGAPRRKPRPESVA